MLSLRKYNYRLFDVYIVIIIACVSILYAFQALCQESLPDIHGNPVGVFIEKLSIDKETRKIDKCSYCGKFMKLGGIHKDADVVIGNQVREELDYRKIPYEFYRENKKDGKYLHIYIYRFEERKGGDFAVEKPAGVGFHIHVMEHNNLKRVFVFDEDQRSLSENVFDIGKFFRRGGKWITVDVLSQEGIEKGMDLLVDDLK